MRPRQTPRAELLVLRDRFHEAWPRALAIWSKFTRLRTPELCLSVAEARSHGLQGSFAMIRLVDQAVVVSLPGVARAGLGDHALEILAHEVGHHVLAPATLADHVRTISRMRWALPSIEGLAPFVANLYTDLLINDRLQRSASLRMAGIYRLLLEKGESGAVWALYMRIYEVLWSLPRGELGGGKVSDAIEGDAWLGARLIRSYQRDWLDGSGRFAALFFPHLLDDKSSMALLEPLFDTRDAAVGGEPSAVTDEEAGEREGAIHPAQDPSLNGDMPAEAASDAPLAQRPTGQAREPFQYGEILRSAGIRLTDHEAAVRYYRERALPHLVRFPTRVVATSREPLPEGLEPWEIGDAPDDIDWIGTVLTSPRVVPGLTTRQRVFGTVEGNSLAPKPVDLDLYVDSSGSMANPQRQMSFPALAGAILCLSALRAGGRVQVTLWSGKGQFASTAGFVRTQTEILQVLTGYFGGGTAFPIHVLRETFSEKQRLVRPVHIVVISDDGVSTLFETDELGNSGWDIARRALERAEGGGTLVLNLSEDWQEDVRGKGYLARAHASILRAHQELGFLVHRVASWEGLVDFAREFSRRHYGAEAPRGT